MRTFLSRDQIKIPTFTSKWLAYSYAFLVVAEFLDGLTTKIGLNLGLTEVGTYAEGVLGNYGFWGLMAWKYSIVAAVGALIFLFYYGVKKYYPTRLKLVSCHSDYWLLNCRYSFTSGCRKQCPSD